ncbi:hypothetical protein COW36_19490 [bacterium (Candidatus Blackallbacteria) CG17_big_fil_post_rev_8_21_14_2_50_48_46]|uniref:Uncharacterized protein n=1 Tax=bacterium (Candidatus Blackallbacteria) CG17_big_fil_post_rev_8_21_14_2_50_48_46 TaxID=2014261 RepID=A0A2M7FZV8_9BACT|nr:MAG: hypothetical protein COW64_15805 [bacterium (Candidatus Blackallbacteria) CG18_big_fil_WC_8_21_14_2_50_49_26]PIW14836.1 MAG: hypothetical protein COW36_19490 [bacterium (Candidatus Blackallbacteria) CG17_big_fil_post_rev_8_21_14_2_50_48_46]PIW44403.1 MAG: hypothetical protein COW20_24065 [bacterium (Candidatus Blackallbacteria) CG13_big_fil_rev_8_21_14_2_50_49_14]
MSQVSSLSLSALHLQVRNQGGYCPLTDWTLLQVRGKDAGAYLQTQLTSDILALQAGQGQRSALVDRKGHIQAEFYVYFLEQTYLILVERSQAERLSAHLEAFHFIEEVEISQPENFCLTLLCGPAARKWLAEFDLKFQSPLAQAQALETQGFCLKAPLTGDLGYVLVQNQAQVEAFKHFLSQKQILEITPEVWNSLTLEAAVPVYGKDFDSETLLPETGLEHLAVSYDKGCYLGQEIIARIKAYGVIPRALSGLIFAPDSALPESEYAIQQAGKTIGKLTRLGTSPVLEKSIALAYLHKNWRVPGQILEWEHAGQQFCAEVVALPFTTCPNESEQAQILLEQALICFAGPEEPEAVPLLEEALLLDPALKDAYESLGVILSRQGEHQKAIEVMEKLLKLAPDEAMAHTNLSRFHMLLGDRDTAEKHMAEATRLNMLRQQAQAERQAQDQAQKKAQEEGRIQMIAMFREVIETEDPDDLVANFGLGKIYLEQQAPEQARPYLESATRIDPLYSAAWLQLGKCLENLNLKAEALNAYREGIAAASRKGDLMPLKEMENRLQVLESSVGV